MRFHMLRLLVVVLALTAFATTGKAQDARKVSKKVLPSVVSVLTKDLQGELNVLGSGFFVESDLIITARHVVRDQMNIKFRPTGSKDVLEALEFYLPDDPDLDLVAVRVKGWGRALKLADLNKLETGEPVFGFGAPFGLEGSVTAGILSSRSLRGKRALLLQVTTPVSQGMSGGPLTNAKGEVIGVSNGFVPSGQNLSFAVPAIFIESATLKSKDPKNSISLSEMITPIEVLLRRVMRKKE